MEVTVFVNIRTALAEWALISIIAELAMSTGILLRPENYFYFLFTLLLYIPVRVYTMRLG